MPAITAMPTFSVLARTLSVPTTMASPVAQADGLSTASCSVLIVVVRYFGGILLGASGLANAYKTAARDAINNAEIIEKTIDMRYRLHFEYALMNDVMRIIKEYNLVPLNQDFNLDCRLDVEVRQSLSVRFYDAIANLRAVKIESI